MKSLVYIGIFLLALSVAAAVQGPFTHNGKEYYVVTSTDPSEDTGDEVCAKVGKTCVGYTEKSAAVCKQVHTGATEKTDLSGDVSGVFCDGSPQGGVCGTNSNTCLTCPTCSTGVACHEAIGGLYREMYVECSGSANCPVTLYAKNTADLINEIPLLNSNLQNCQNLIPSQMARFVRGNIQVDVAMNNGGTQTFTVLTDKKEVTGIQVGPAARCKQKLTVAESDLNTVLSSADQVNAIMRAFANKQVSVSGCTVFSNIITTITAPVARFVVQRALPPVTPPSNCGQVGEQCNNRACYSGMCASPYEFKNGRWQSGDFRCIDQQEYNTYCIARGNTRSAWDCLSTMACS